MSPVPFAAAIAAFVMPLAASVDAWRHPPASWSRVTHRRWFSGIAPALVTLLSPAIWTAWPTVLALALAAFYAAKVRPLLSLADGMDRPRSPETTKLTPREHGDVGEMFLAGGGVVLFGIFVGFAARTGRELLIGVAIVVVATAVIAARIVFIVRRANSR